METKLDEPSMREITSSLGFPFASLVPSIDISGGLCLCWKSGVDIEITSQNKNLINALIFSDPPFSPWMLSAIYVPPIAHLRNVFWESLNKTGQSFCGPRLCIGDFNVLLSQSDKRGGRPFASSYTNIFGSLISDHGLIDLGFSGNPFTWSNKRSSLANIKERLNRAFSNSEWRLLFPNATLLHYPATSSDHNPLILNTSGTILSLPKPFRFEAFWTRDSSSSQGKGGTNFSGNSDVGVLAEDDSGFVEMRRSSANWRWVIWGQRGPSLIPCKVLAFSACWRSLARISEPMMKRNGDSESPCLRPLSDLILPNGLPLSNTEQDVASSEEASDSFNEIKIDHIPIVLVEEWRKAIGARGFVGI
uniref:Endonuclease/exonuclease/phosphatase domain-containing protein n=1 Tax=Fagus sylvatica TaxID=28930 RepID=A0A2N9IBA5_FAGSY